MAQQHTAMMEANEKMVQYVYHDILFEFMLYEWADSEGKQSNVLWAYRKMKSLKKKHKPNTHAN